MEAWVALALGRGYPETILQAPSTCLCLQSILPSPGAPAVMTHLQVLGEGLVCTIPGHKHSDQRDPQDSRTPTETPPTCQDVNRAPRWLPGWLGTSLPPTSTPQGGPQTHIPGDDQLRPAATAPVDLGRRHLWSCEARRQRTLFPPGSPA